MINNNSCVFLDFDGVLFNTAKEAYIVSCIATGMLKSIDEVDFSSPHYITFLKYRYLVGPAWNYKYIIELLNNKDFSDFESVFKKLIKNVKKDDYIEFEESFFNTRINLKQDYFDSWLNLNESYDFLQKIKSYLNKKKLKFIIVTTKDKETVKKLLELESITFQDNDIYDKDDFEKHANKANIIKEIIKSRNIKKSIFIDDSLKHLSLCENIKNLKLCQANWGYISSEDNNAMNVEEVIECLV